MSRLRCMVMTGAVPVLVAMAAPLAEAQARRSVAKPPQQLMAEFVRASEHTGETAGASDIMGVVLGRVEYAPGKAEEFFQSLESLALNGPVGRAQDKAVLLLGLAGSHRSSQPRAGTFARLERIYRDAPSVRSLVVIAMAELVEQPAALAFLERVATAPTPEFPEASLSAISSLQRMGDEGRRTLRRMHLSKSVTDPDGRLSLEYLSAKDYRGE